MKWTQCRFVRPVENGLRYTVAWIDTKAAKVGNKVELIDLDGEFWDVISTGAQTDKDPTEKYRTWNNNI